MSGWHQWGNRLKGPTNIDQDKDFPFLMVKKSTDGCIEWNSHWISHVGMEQRVRMMASYLEEAPLHWYHWTARAKEQPLSYEEVKGGLISMYDRSNTNDYSGELSKLKHERSNYEEYQGEFMRTPLCSWPFQRLPSEQLRQQSPQCYHICNDGQDSNNDVGDDEICKF